MISCHAFTRALAVARWSIVYTSVYLSGDESRMKKLIRFLILSLWALGGGIELAQASCTGSTIFVEVLPTILKPGIAVT